MPEFMKPKACPCRILHVHHIRGLTLIEVMIALMIFSVGILAVASMQSHGMRSTTSARQRLGDTTALVRQLELLMALGYDHAQLLDGDNGFSPEHPDHGPVDIVRSGSTLEWEVADNAPVAGVKHILVTLRQRGSEGTPGGFSFDCLKAGGLPSLEN